VQLDEDKRRHLYSQRYFSLSISALSLVIVTALILSFTLPPKECYERQTLRFNTVCTDCQVDKCANCLESGISGCDRCEKGLFFNGEKCTDCDDFEDTVICAECSALNECTKCNLGYRLGFPDTDYEGK